MKILQAGTKPNLHPWVGFYLCASCGSVLELTDEDADKVKGWEDDQRDGMSVTVVCPVCEAPRSFMEFKKTTLYHDNRQLWDQTFLRRVPPPGPSNIIVRTPNPLPAPKKVSDQ